MCSIFFSDLGNDKELDLSKLLKEIFMNVLTNFFNRFRTKDPIEISRPDLMALTISLLREADRLEHSSTDLPGKAAIEFLLNMKYAVVENRELSTHTQDQLLSTIDNLLNKIAGKYKVTKKGREYIFNEGELIITHPECAIDKEQIIICTIHKEQAELESLRAQLVHTNLQCSLTLRLKQAILDKECHIRHLKKDLRMLKYFKSWGCNSISNLRNIGEKAMSEEKKLSEVMLEKLDKLQEKEPSRTSQLIKSSGLLGAGIGGAAGLLANRGPGMIGGGLKGVIAGSVAALLLAGGGGLAELVRKARQGEPSKVKTSINNAVDRANRSTKLSSTQKTKIKNNAKIAISKIDSLKKRKNESLETNKEVTSTSLLEKLDNILELKKSTVAGGAVGAAAGNAIARKKASAGFSGKALKAAKSDVKRTSDIAKSAAEKAKNLSKGGLAHKIKNAGQINRAKGAAKIAKANAKGAASGLAKATKAISKAGMRGGVKGALIGGAAAAGAAGLAKALRNRKDRFNKSLTERLDNRINDLITASNA